MQNHTQNSKLTKHQKQIKQDVLTLHQFLSQAQPKLQMFQTNKCTLQQIISKLQSAQKYTNVQITSNNLNLIYLQSITQVVLNELSKIVQMTDPQFQQWYILSKQDAVLQNSMYQSSQNVNYFDQIYQAQSNNQSLDQISEYSEEEEQEEEEEDEVYVKLNQLNQKIAELLFIQIFHEKLLAHEQAWKQHLQQQGSQQQQQQQQQANQIPSNFQITDQASALYRSQKNPNQVVVDKSQYKIETPLPQCFKTRYSIPIIVKHPQLTQDIEFSISRDVDIETVWDKVQVKVKLSKFNLLWFQEPQLNDKKHQRYEPLSKLQMQKDRLEFSIVTTQLAHFVVDQKTDNEFKYYYELKMNNETYKMAGDGISFMEKTRGYILISQLYKDDEVMDKKTFRFVKVQSIRICHPAKPVYTSTKGQQKDQAFQEKYVLNLQELEFLDNQNYVQITFNYHEGSIYKYKHQYMIKKGMPSYLLPSFYKYKQHLFNPEQSIYYDGFEYNPNQLIRFQQSIDINNTARSQDSVIPVEVRICGGEIFEMDVQVQLYQNHLTLDLSAVKSKLTAQYGQGSIYRGSTKINDIQSCVIPTSKQAVFQYYQSNDQNDAITLNFVINSKIYQYPFCLTDTVNDVLYLCCKIVDNYDLSAYYVVNYKELNLLEVNEAVQLQNLNMRDQDYISIFYLSGHKSPSFYSKYMSFNNRYSIDEIINDIKLNQPLILNYSKQRASKIQALKKNTPLSEGEIFSIMLYTSQHIYADLNSNLGATKVFQGDEHTASYTNFMTSMLSGLAKLTPHIGKVYRGIKQRVDAEKVRIGKFVCFQSFLSSSEKKDVAWEFAKNDDDPQQQGTFFEISTLSGVAISQFSEYVSEKEILLTPYIWYKVINAQFIQEHNIQYVALQEVPTPKSFRIALICSELGDVNNRLKQLCSSKGYTCVQVCGWEDLDLSFQRFQHFYNNLAPDNMLIIINATKELDKRYLEVLLTKFKYRREVFYYSQIEYDISSYMGLVRKLQDGNNINQNYMHYINDELTNLILNYYKVPLKLLDLTYNREWIAGKVKKGALEYHYPHQFQGIGVKVRNSNCFSNDYCVAYVGIEFDKLINYLMQYPNTKYPMVKIGETICGTPNLYFTNNAQEAAYMVAPKVLENKQFYLVLQVRLFIKAIQVFNQETQACQVYTCSSADYICIQRILVQTV